MSTAGSIDDINTPTFDLSDMFDESIIYGKDDTHDKEKEETMSTLSSSSKPPEGEGLLSSPTKSSTPSHSKSPNIPKLKTRTGLKSNRGKLVRTPKASSQQKGKGKISLMSEDEEETAREEEPNLPSKKALLDQLNERAAILGILPPPEFGDLLYRNMMTDRKPFSDRELTLFLLGVTAERNFSAIKALNETIATMSSEVSRLNKVVNHLDETRRKVSADSENALSEVKDIKSKIFEALEGPEEEDEEEYQQELELPKFIQEEKQAPLYSDPSSSKTHSIEADVLVLIPHDNIKISHKEIGHVDISHLDVPDDPTTLLKVLAVTLGLDDSASENEKFIKMVRHGLTKTEKIILFNGKADDEFVQHAFAKMKKFKTEHPEVFE
ncbi:TPA_asm: P [Bouteloa betacytorhabdovirus 1]|nr:TPA_asm: P [Bouteloa betacytorhabdovirus 1]